MMIRCLQRMRESESALRQLIQERNEAEREKWTILRHARDEAERCLAVTTQLTARDAKIDQLQEELAQVKKEKVAWAFEPFTRTRGFSMTRPKTS
jgi:hypothetical protein